MAQEEMIIPERGTWQAVEYCLEQAKKHTQGELRAYLEVLGFNLESALVSQADEMKRLGMALERTRAYREWLRDGFREIARGTASVEAKADSYVQYARDMLSGPTESILVELIERRKTARETRAALSPQEPQDGEKEGQNG